MNPRSLRVHNELILLRLMMDDPAKWWTIKELEGALYFHRDTLRKYLRQRSDIGHVSKDHVANPVLYRLTLRGMWSIEKELSG